MYAHEKKRKKTTRKTKLINVQSIEMKNRVYVAEGYTLYYIMQDLSYKSWDKKHYTTRHAKQKKKTKIAPIFFFLYLTYEWVW